MGKHRPTSPAPMASHRQPSAGWQSPKLLAQAGKEPTAAAAESTHCDAGSKGDNEPERDLPSNGNVQLSDSIPTMGISSDVVGENSYIYGLAEALGLDG